MILPGEPEAALRGRNHAEGQSGWYDGTRSEGDSGPADSHFHAADAGRNEFLGQPDKLPFDEHWLIARAAPRPFIALEGTRGQNVNANGRPASVAGDTAGLQAAECGR
jgi:hypothetical protein